MQETSVQKIAGLLKVLVNITLVCNLVALPVVPPLVYWRENSFLLAGKLSLTGDLFSFWLEGVSKVWSAPYTLMLALFLLFSGCCTAVVLWQGRRVLNTILRGEPFSMENAVSLKRAAVCAFCIAAAALVRVVFSVCLSGSPRAPADLQRPVRAHLRHGGTAVSHHVGPVPSGGGDQGRERPDHLRRPP